MQNIELVVQNSSLCECPDECTTVWYRNEISSGTFPNSVWEYPNSVLKRPEFQRLSTNHLDSYAKYSNLFQRRSQFLFKLLNHQTQKEFRQIKRLPQVGFWIMLHHD